MLKCDPRSETAKASLFLAAYILIWVPVIWTGFFQLNLSPVILRTEVFFFFVFSSGHKSPKLIRIDVLFAFGD